MLHALPESFVRTITGLFEDRGVAWLEQLPTLIAECEARWTLRVGAPFLLSYNYVAPATRADGTEIVLKLGVPNAEMRSEIEALRIYNGRGIAQMFYGNSDEGILLLERLRPGTMLSELEDDEAATAIAANVMRQLWQPAPAEHQFPTIAKWARGLDRLRAEFEGGSGPFPAKLVEQAEVLFAELIASMGEPVLLHGDLHHFNILTAEREPWLAIDPKGIVGEPAYEVGALLRNPNQEIATNPKILARRIDQLSAELTIDRARIIGWGLAQAVLSSWWDYEDLGYGWEPMIELAARFDQLQ